MIRAWVVVIYGPPGVMLNTDVVVWTASPSVGHESVVVLLPFVGDGPPDAPIQVMSLWMIFCCWARREAEDTALVVAQCPRESPCWSHSRDLRRRRCWCWPALLAVQLVYKTLLVQISLPRGLELVEQVPRTLAIPGSSARVRAHRFHFDGR